MCGGQQHVMNSNYTIDIHFLTSNQTIAEIMPRLSTLAADPVCAMWCPDSSHTVSRRMNYNSNAFRKVLQKDQENQWPGFLSPLSGAIQKAYTPFFLNYLS